MRPSFDPQWRNLQCESLPPTKPATGGAITDMLFFWESNPRLSPLCFQGRRDNNYTLEPQRVLNSTKMKWDELLILFICLCVISASVFVLFSRFSRLPPESFVHQYRKHHRPLWRPLWGSFSGGQHRCFPSVFWSLNKHITITFLPFHQTQQKPRVPLLWLSTFCVH